MNQPNLPIEILKEIVIQSFGSQVELQEYRLLNWHTDYFVVFARLNHPAVEVSVKLARPEAPLDTEFDRTALLHQLITEKTSLQVADILAVDTSCKVFPYRYLIKSYVRGQEWSTVNPQLDSTQRADAFRQLGQVVAELHAITFPHFGEIGIVDETTKQSSYIEALIKRTHDKIKQQHLREILVSVIEARSHLFNEIQSPRLCHDDLHHYNILFNYENRHWKLATILDFDKAWSGHPESDLARLDLWTNMMSPEFRETYHAVHPIDHAYQQRRPVYQLLWCLEYANPSFQHLEDTRQVCAELGITPLESF